jgi:hypothetical protein
MTNQELMAAMQQSGRLAIVQIGDSVPKGTIAYSLPAKRPVLKSRRFAMVIDNELHVRKYEDPAHGWLAVPMQWLEAFGIVNDVSCCSYLKGGTAYLEEDCDAPLFRKATEKHGFRLFVDHRHTNDRSAIRSYPSFN